MNATAIRRYLQPSPTLRWHPWAPVIAGFLLLSFLFVLGAQWGYGAAKRDINRLEKYSYAGLVRVETQSRFPARDIVRKAGAIDAAVLKFVHDSEQQPGALERVRSEAERLLFRGGRESYAIPRQAIVDLAEFRLRELSGAAPQWQVTSGYCAEFLPILTGRDLRNFEAAEAYTKLLGRPITPEQLAPAVANARCEPSRRIP